MNKTLITISKFLSLVLRHKPGIIGLSLDRAGWVQVDELLSKAQHAGIQLDRDTLHQIIEQSDKKRFTLSEDGTKIKASYGHSIPVELGLEPLEPPEFLFHGTATRFLPQIRKYGLKQKGRQYVHLVTDEQRALDVGGRHGKPVVLVIKAHVMYTDGFIFFKSESDIWLTEHVPAAYILFPEIRYRI